MKSLDEVIEELEDFLIEDEGMFADALHYLKEYKQDKQIYAYDIARRNLELSERNEPLSWEQLKQMTGQPVWVEIGNGWKGWVIIRKITDAGIVSGSDGFIGVATAYGMDTTWKAYRKERE